MKPKFSNKYLKNKYAWGHAGGWQDASALQQQRQQAALLSISSKARQCTSSYARPFFEDMAACCCHSLQFAALLVLVVSASASQQDGAVAEVIPDLEVNHNLRAHAPQVDQAAAVRAALHLNVEVSGDEFHLANAHSLQTEGRIIARPARVFNFDPAREFGVGISHEAQRHVDEFLGALEHTTHMYAHRPPPPCCTTAT